MRRKRLHCKGSGYADGIALGVGTVVEILRIGMASDSGIYVLLLFASSLPKGFLRCLGAIRGLCRQDFGDLPFFKLLAQSPIERCACFVQHRLPLSVDIVNFSVVSNRLEHEMGHALKNEPLANVVGEQSFSGSVPSQFSFSLRT